MARDSLPYSWGGQTSKTVGGEREVSPPTPSLPEGSWRSETPPLGILVFASLFKFLTKILNHQETASQLFVFDL